jgi:hypothetical protein
MYELMESCWEIQPKARPTFTAMLETLTAMLKESEVSDRVVNSGLMIK